MTVNKHKIQNLSGKFFPKILQNTCLMVVYLKCDIGELPAYKQYTGSRYSTQLFEEMVTEPPQKNLIRYLLSKYEKTIHSQSLF